MNTSIPDIVTKEKSEKSESPFSGSLPPWKFCFNILLLPKHIVVPLLPSDNSVNVYSVSTHSPVQTATGIVVTNHSGVISSHSFSFKSNKSKLTNSRLALKEVLGIALSLSHCHSKIDIFVQSSSDYFFATPSSRHDSLDAENFTILTSIRGRINLYFGLHSANAGYEAAREVSTRNSPLVMVNFPPSKFENKREIECLLISVWESEWSSTQKGETTRNFFPNVKAAAILKTKKSNNKIAQILTGHCLLNAHQQRFGFVKDPSCSCGDPIESIPHFLFFCPTYDIIRREFKDISLEVCNTWPPELSMIPQSDVMWRAMKNFIFKSKRLDPNVQLRK